MLVMTTWPTWKYEVAGEQTETDWSLPLSRVEPVMTMSWPGARAALCSLGRNWNFRGTEVPTLAREAALPRARMHRNTTPARARVCSIRSKRRRERRKGKGGGECKPSKVPHCNGKDTEAEVVV